jgi:hypothetical protein
VRDEATSAALFFPYEDNRERFDVPEGKTRFFFYSLCDTCCARADREEALQEVIQRG